MAEVKTYTAASAISHDGTLYRPGETLELSEQQAAELGSALVDGEGVELPLGRRPAVNNTVEMVEPAAESGVKPTTKAATKATDK